MSKLSALPLPSPLLSAIIELPAFTPFPLLPFPFPCTVTQLIYAKMLGRLMTLCSKRRQRSAALLLQWVKGRGERHGKRSEPGVSMGMARKTFWHAVSLLVPCSLPRPACPSALPGLG